MYSFAFPGLWWEKQQKQDKHGKICWTVKRWQQLYLTIDVMVDVCNWVLDLSVANVSTDVQQCLPMSIDNW